jgi:predicted ATPase
MLLQAINLDVGTPTELWYNYGYVHIPELLVSKKEYLMSIKHVKVSNFKSFKELDIDLGPFNVVIGANASGKSNFIDIFRFLRDIAQSGLKNAVSMQGGAEYLRNMNVGASQNSCFEITTDEKTRLILSAGREGISYFTTNQIVYNFVLEFTKKGGGYKVIKEKLILRGKVSNLNKEGDNNKEIDAGEITLSNTNGRMHFENSLSDKIKLENNNIISLLFNQHKIAPRSLFIEELYPIPINPSPTELFSGISIYDFDPKLPKKAVPITGKTELEEDGNNLAIVLKDILDDASNRRKFSNLIRDILPFVEDVNVEKFADKSLMLNVKEVYTQKKRYFPASLMSDGTINITALIIALYFEIDRFIIIEEPERNIHPHLISKITSFLKEASNKKQIVVTTHNPDMVKYIDIKDLLLISRDRDGFSIVSRPIEKEHVKIFLENEIGIEDLYVQNLLGA